MNDLLHKWKDYESKLSIMGQERNSYSKTGPDATFMRMKEDHMLNGQLKLGYNVQIAVNSEYITGVAAYVNRNDNGTLIPFLKILKRGHGQRNQRIVADAGYESQENYLLCLSFNLNKLFAKANSNRLKTHLFEKLVL